MYAVADLIPPADLFETEYDPRLPYGTRVNSREAYPGVIRPLDLTAVALPNDHGIRRQLRDLGVCTIDPPALLTNRVHRGRVYVNLSWVLWMADIIPGADGDDFERQLFGQHIPFEITRPAITPAQRRRVRLFGWRFVGWVVASVLVVLPRLNTQLAARRDMRLSDKTPQELDDLIEPYQEQLVTACNWNTRGTLGGLMLIGALTRILGEDKAKHIIPILSDLGDVESAAPAQRIRQIAQRARARRNDLATALKASQDRWQLLAAKDSQAHAELQAVIDRYGYRSVAEFLINVPSWSEDPTPVMDAFVGLLTAAPADPRARHHEQEQARHALLDGSGWLRRRLISLLVKCAHLGARTRERAKAGLIIRVDMLRQLFREVGRRLVAANRLDAVEDLYYLTLAEVRAALRGEGAADLRALSAQRQVEVARLEAMGEPAELICGTEPVSLAAAAGQDPSVLHGLGVSGGAVQGIARVVTGTDALDLFEPGEILVAPYTDAGWTPYFTLASAVIVETGGLLTHTSVVARELGLTAVVNVRDATSLIKTGDELHLDPNSGCVHIVARAVPATVPAA